MIDAARAQLDQQPVRAVLRRLLEAHELAAAAGKDPWEFAVEIATLAELGTSHSQLRWLIAEGLVEARRETTTASAPQRTFCKLRSLTLPDRSCLLLSPDGLEKAQKLAESSSKINSDEPAALPRADVKSGHNALPRPTWDADRRELHFQGQLIKVFRVPAANQEAVLSAFEQAGWPPSIPNPLGNSSDQTSQQRLRNTIRALNRCHVRSNLRFHGDGTGLRISWSAAAGNHRPIVHGSTSDRTLSGPTNDD